MRLKQTLNNPAEALTILPSGAAGSLTYYMLYYLDLFSLNLYVSLFGVLDINANLPAKMGPPPAVGCLGGMLFISDLEIQY